MTTKTEPRKWAMTKMDSGLWLLPSNDERWVFKLHKRELYDEPSIDEPGRWETVWEASVRDFDAFAYVVQMSQFTRRYSLHDLLHGDEWTHICYVGTRREAIEEALAWEIGRRHEG